MTLLGLVVAPRVAEAELVDRVVAVVDHEIITLSDVKARARPELERAQREETDPLRRAKREADVLRRTLRAIVDDTLLERAAAHEAVFAFDEEIDGALRQIAVHAKVSVPELLRHVEADGRSVEEYRSEIRRQLLLGKLVALRQGDGHRPRAPATDEELEKEAKAWLAQLRRRSYVDERL